MRNGIFIVAITLATLTGCASASTDHATASPTTGPTTAGAPSSFPDLTNLAPVDANDYRQSYPYFNGVRFSTPDGQSCDQNAMNSLDDPANVVLSCRGPRSDKGPGNWSVTVARDEAATIEQASVDPPEGSPVKNLPVGHVIDYKGIMCGAIADGTTACRVGDHGFVLTSTSTTLF